MIQSLENLSTQQILADALLADPAIDDCVVLQRKTASSTTPELVAYIVVTGLFLPQQIESRLKAIPGIVLPKAYVPLFSLPLTATGEIDEQALLNVEVINADIEKQWEKQLQLLPEIEQVAVVVQEYAQKKIPPLHLSDVLPQQKIHAIKQIDVTAPTPIPILVEKEQRLAISDGGLLPEEANAPTTLPATLRRTAKQSLGQKIAYLQPNGTEITQSYAQLLEEAERILAGLRTWGLKPQDKVIIQLELNQDLLPAFWGCILGGFIPAIAPVAPTYNEAGGAVDKLCGLWQLLDKPVIITCEALHRSVQSLAQWLPGEKLQIAIVETLRANQPDKNHHLSLPEDVAFFNLTSGSTGTPKCIMLTHRNILSRARGTNQLCQHASEDIILNWLPFDHIGSISDWHLRCVYLGCQLIYATKEYVLSHPLNWLDAIAKYRITHSWAPNFAYALVNDALKHKENNQWDLSCVKALLTAGEAVSSKAVEDFIANLATYGFKDTAIRPAFGMAEMGSGITYAQSEDKNALRFHTFDKDSLTGELTRVSLDSPNSATFTDLGPVIPSVSIRIVNSENVILPEDTIGNLQVKGDAVSPGYYKNPTINREVFLADGWFNTGDLGLIASGHLVVTGRAKETIIINGANYYNHEIESVVETVEGVEVSYTAACAVQSPSSATEKLAIFFNCAYSGDALLELIKQIRDRVLQQAAVNPDYLIPISQNIIPKTAIGKIQRSQLSKRFEAGEFDSILKQIDIESGNANTLPDWFYRKIWRPKTATTKNSAISTGTSLVFFDNLGLGQILCQQLRQDKRQCVEVEFSETFAKLANNSYSIDPQNPDHYQQLLVILAAENYQIDQIIHLGNYAPLVADFSSLEMLEQSQEIGIYSLLHLVQAISKELPSDFLVRLLVVSSHTQAVSPTETIACDRTPILGLIKTIPQEIPQIDCRHLDLTGESLEVNATNILHELQVAQIEPEVAYRDFQRLIPRLEKVAILPPKQEIPFQKGGMYVISGGLGGISVEIAKYLLDEYEAKLLLIGRTPLPPENQWQSCLALKDITAQRLENYLTLKQLGGEVLYQALDICDLEQLKQSVTQAKSLWGCELHGIIHLAGSVQERLLVEETRSSFAQNLQAKVSGTWTLHQLVKNQPNSIFISFSSINGFFGGKNVGAYSAANSFLDSFTHYQRTQCQLHSFCFAWSMWEEVGMSRGFQMKELSRAQGYYAIAIGQGLQSLQIGLQQNDYGQLLIGLDGSNRNIRRYTETSSHCRQITAYFTAHQPIAEDKFKNISVSDFFGTPTTCHQVKIQEMPLTATGEIDRDRLSATGSRVMAKQVAPRTEIETQLVTIWKKVLGVAQVGINDNFFELGGSSVLAAQLFTQINEVIGQNLPLATLFQAPTIEKLASLLNQEEWSASWSSLVAIQPKGSKPPFFCIHGAGGNVLMYRKLAEYLGSDQPVYGLQAKGMDGMQDMLTQVEDMAAHYIEEIRAFQPEGPYFLGGLSFGGIASLEIAQRLQDQGQKVALLALIDSHGPGYPKLLPIAPRLLALMPPIAYHFGQRLKARIENYFNPKPKKIDVDGHFSDLDNFSEDPSSANEGTENQAEIDRIVDSSRSFAANITSFKDWLENLSLWSLRFTPWAFIVPKLYLGSGRSLPSSLQRVREANVRAMLEYAPQNYSAPIVLFRATKQPPGCYKDPQLGWGKIATGNLEIYDIPGYHSEALLSDELSIQPLAKLLKNCLNKAQVENQ